MRPAALLQRTPSHDHNCRMCGHQATHSAGNVDGYDLRTCQICRYSFVPAVTPRHVTLRANPGHDPCNGTPTTAQAGPDHAFLDIALRRARTDKPLHILDFGSGHSDTAQGLRDQGHRVIAIDTTAPREPHPDRLTGDLLATTLPAEPFDLTYSYQVFEHLAEPRPYLDELLRLTKRGGHVLIHTDMETPDRGPDLTSWGYVKPPHHCSFYRHETFQRYFQGTPHRIVHLDAKRVLVRRG